MLKKAGVLKNGEKWEKTGKKRAKNGDCPHFIQSPYKNGTARILYNSAGLINQTPIQEKPNAYIRKIKTVQFIYIIEKVGLMNQAPTERQEG